MEKMHTYEVTEKARTFVAGVRNPGLNKTLTLTEEQAAYALRAGELRLAGGAAKPKKAKPAKPVAPEGEAPIA